VSVDVRGLPFGARTAVVVDTAAQFGDAEWERLVRVGLLGSRRVADCRAQWFNNICVNKAAWSADEDERLLELAEAHGERHVRKSQMGGRATSETDRQTDARAPTLNGPGVGGMQWQETAAQLGSGRSAADCLGRHQALRSVGCTAGRWTPEEDARLRDAVGRLGADWQAVARDVGGGRTAQQAMFRCAGQRADGRTDMQFGRQRGREVVMRVLAFDDPRALGPPRS
jgi:Myb-like DNA-binding domain